MTNEDIREDLKAFLDGELSPERTQVVQTAIESDPSMREEAEYMSLISKSIKQFATVPSPSTDAAEKVVARYRKRKWWLSPLGLTTVAASMFFIGFLIFPTAANMREVARQRATGAPYGGIAPGAKLNQMAPAEDQSLRETDAKSAAPALTGVAGGVELLDVPRQVIRRATLGIRVVSAEESEKKVTSLVNGWGGFVQDTQSYNLDSESPQVVLTLRVPAKHFDHALVEFESLGVRTEKTITGEDVTAQMADMDARLKNLKAQELTYRQILGQAKKVGEVLEVQQYLTDIRGQIESLEAQLKSTRNLATLSIITLTLQQRPSENESPKDKGWADDTWANAVNGLRAAFQAVGRAIITTFVYAPIWLPLVIIVWLLARRMKVQK